ncbi:recombinase family protein [Psychroflexus halocasei]|uniref:Site-specific DNA recombinase n=1 Tax=Psychroflexus halocasei TaxID=908615 RepID=A0A1H4DXZ8_9FLAO|nr:recombinase family protein [Psychroflexus halocasei]SEA77486.1 Site-specific DNA recombinase [Psychroflexus halocasei]
MIGIYTRLSKEDDSSSSIENQIREGKSFVKSINKPFKIYNEGEGVSGAVELEDRPELLKLYNDLKTNKLTGVWFRNENRLSRSQRTYILFIDLCLKNDIDVYFNNKKIDLTNPSNSLTGSILAAINSYTLKLQSKQTKTAIKNNIEAGRVHGLIPYGFKADKNRKMVIDKEEAEVVKWLYNKHIEGFGCRSLAKKLNEKGVKNRGKYFDLTGIHYLLNNELYKGQRYFSGSYYPVNQIVTDEVWEASQLAFRKNIKNSGKKSKNNYLLIGLITCVHCQSGFSCKIGKGNEASYYFCKGRRYRRNCNVKSLNMNNLDNLIWDYYFVEKNLLKKLKLKVDKVSNSSYIKALLNDLKKLNNENDILVQNKKRAVNLAVSGVIDEKDIKVELIKIDNRKIKIEKDIIEVNEKLDFYNNSKELLNNLENINLNNSFENKKKLITRYIDEILISSDYVKKPTNKKLIDNKIMYGHSHQVVVKFKMLLEPDYFYYNSNKFIENTPPRKTAGLYS